MYFHVKKILIFLKNLLLNFSFSFLVSFSFLLYPGFVCDHQSHKDIHPDTDQLYVLRLYKYLFRAWIEPAARSADRQSVSHLDNRAINIVIVIKEVIKKR